MPPIYILVDYENVQPSPEEFELLGGRSDKVFVFFGSTQKRFPVKAFASLLPLGENVSYIQVENAGKNALDIVIGWTIGFLCAQEPNAIFNIIAKDTGYEALKVHLRKRKFKVNRFDLISDLPFAKKDRDFELLSHYDDIVEYLRKLKARPGSEKSLINALITHFGNQIAPDEIAPQVDLLKSKCIVKVDGKKLTYPGFD